LTFSEDVGNVLLMARIAKVIIPGILHHLTQRGNRRMQIFFSDDDYREYIALMADSCRRLQSTKFVDALY
jgi:REP element-mobilizing transposase RayT